MLKLRIFLFASLSVITSAVFAAAPSGYYNTADGLCGQKLIEALSQIIDDHNALSYKGVWSAYKTTDLDSDGLVWDMYSTKRWKYGSEQCGSYSSIGDCYNREHSFPKSWFDDAHPMYTDLYHLYPTDGKVNGQRSNFPFGECANGTYVSPSGSVRALGRLGSSTFQGYSGTVFEPDDQYKGDFARTYFYMATRYYGINSSWHSDMLAGNSYPFFKSWAVDLLLKWHRQDPVSDKETARNDAISELQHNRNPFIDHPELAEHIWGNRKTSAWSSKGVAVAEIMLPVDGSSVDMGVTARDMPVSRDVEVRTKAATAAVSLSAAGAFTVTPSSLTAAEANAGKTVRVQYQATSLGKATGTLTVATGDVRSVVSLTAEAVDGLPATKATYVSEESFRANWTYIGDDIYGKYEFVVTDSEGPLDGYPLMVDAAAGYYDVRGLQPETTYTYTLRSYSLTSNSVSVTTAAAIPFVDFLFDGDLYFTTAPGEPSEAAEILVQIENIDSPVTVSVGSPFELSLDRGDWSRSITLDPDESRLYLRLNSATAGVFESTLKAVAGTYVNDNTTVHGTATDRADFLEDFEAEPAPSASYSPSSYSGTAAVWNLYNAGHWADQDPGHDSKVAVRFGKAGTALCAIEMAEPKKSGAGTVSFWAKKWSEKEAKSNIAVEISLDYGHTWQEAGNTDITDAAWKKYTFTVNKAGDVLLRLRRTDGARMHVDDIAISDYSTGVSDPAAERHQWDAYCLGGRLTVTVATAGGIDLAAYTVAGVRIFDGHIGCGVHSFDNIAAGQFVIVSSGDFTRTVLIR